MCVCVCVCERQALQSVGGCPCVWVVAPALEHVAVLCCVLRAAQWVRVWRARPALFGVGLTGAARGQLSAIAVRTGPQHSRCPGCPQLWGAATVGGVRTDIFSVVRYLPSVTFLFMKKYIGWRFANSYLFSPFLFRLLYSLAFNARFLRHLWFLISSMTTRMITG